MILSLHHLMNFPVLCRTDVLVAGPDSQKTSHLIKVRSFDLKYVI